MPVYRPLRQELLTPAQFEARKPAEPEPIPAVALTSAPTQAREDSFGIDTVTTVGPVRPPSPVDFGKPLNIMIRRIYTGKFPEKKFLGGGRKPMLISTTVKDVTTTSAGARAVNVLKQGVTPKAVFNGPGAAEEGTPLAYYSPAVTSPFITVGFTIIFEDFDQGLFDRISKLLGASAGVPIFVPASAYLMAASTVVKLAGDVGNQVLNGHPVLDENLQLDFSFGGGVPPQPGFFIISSGPIDGKKYQFDTMRGLINTSTSNPYDEEDPVIVVTVDGTAVDGVSNFTPLLASASLLGRFFSQKEDSEVATDTILSAVKLVNDLTFRKKAEEAKAKMAALPTGDPERAKLEAAIKAFNQNIGEGRLQLEVATGTTS
jgi:hypothetical protein